MNDAYASSLSRPMISERTQVSLSRLDAPQADQVGFSLLVSTKTYVRKYFGLIHSELAQVRNEVIHKRTKNHPAECVRQRQFPEGARRPVKTHVTGKIKVRIRSEARPVTLGIST